LDAAKVQRQNQHTLAKLTCPIGRPSAHRLSKRHTCESGHAQPDYDIGLHVGGLFIIFFVSSTGCGFPLLVTKFPRLRIPPSFLFAAKHFGTGVLIATAFVHLLPTAFLSLSNPCLSYFWTEGYQAMPGAIMLASIFFVTIIEMVFSPARHVCGGNEGVAAVSRPVKKLDIGEEKEQACGKEHSSLRNAPGALMRRTYSEGSMQVREIGSLRGRNTSISRTLSRYREEGQRLNAIESLSDTSETPGMGLKYEYHNSAIEDDVERSQHDHVLTPEQIHKKAIMQCFLLEMGILFHSIFIGMSLAVAVGNDFIVLLIAIVFHQTFEGLALGVRIADIKWPKRALQPWLMAIAYGLTTPGGMAIGIATHTLYSPDSEVGLLVVGIMNAVSAGFLVFASLVELMSEDFLSDQSWQVLRGKRRVVACLFVFAGAFLMSLVGAWA
jgi:zinc transporter 1/2/3